MRSQPAVLEQAGGHRRIPGGSLPGEGVGLAGQTAQPVPQPTVQPLHMGRIRTRRQLPQHPAGLYPDRPPMPAMLDHLGQPHAWGGPQEAASPASRSGGDPDRPAYCLAVDPPAVAGPGQALPTPRSSAGLGHHPRRRPILGRGRGPGHHQLRRPVQAQDPPARAHPPDAPSPSPTAGRFF